MGTGSGGRKLRPNPRPRGLEVPDDPLPRRELTSEHLGVVPVGFLDMRALREHPCPGARETYGVGTWASQP